MDVVQGSCHQGHSQYQGAGKQCTCNSLAAMLHAHTVPPKYWSYQDMDLILDEGDRLYSSVNMGKMDSKQQYLLISDLPTQINLHGKCFDMNVHQSVSGTLSRRTSEPPFMSLEDALTNVGKYSFVTFGCYTQAIIKHEDSYYLFDPHSRNELGMATVDGKSTMTLSHSLLNLRLFIQHLSSSVMPKGNDHVFEITPVTLSSADLVTNDSSSSDFDGFSEISDGEYACLTVAINEDLQSKICRIDKEVEEEFNDTFESITSDSDHAAISDTNLENVSYVAEKLDLVPEPDLDGSFLDNVVLQGLLNETDISVDLLADSDDELPLIVLKERMRESSCVDNNTHVSTHPNNVDIHPAVSNTQPESSKAPIADVTTLSTENAERSLFETKYNATDSTQLPESIESDILTDPVVPSCKENIITNIDIDITPELEDGSITEESPRGRKRKRCEKLWKRNVLKQLRNTGQSYTSSRRTRDARKMKKGCGMGCRRKCHEKINEEQRHSIFHEFWSLGDNNRQRDYISSWVTIKQKKSASNQDKNSRRNFSKTWQFKIQGEPVTVCKTFFLDTLDISHSVVDTAIKQSVTDDTLCGIASTDQRGRHINRANKTSSSQVEQVKVHISSFPRIESHYCRRDTNKEYLEPGLSVPKMYSLYVNHCNDNGFTPVSIHTYRHIFVTCFNISFHRPLKDKCDLCARYEKAANLEKSEMESDYLCHIKNKQLVRQMKENDKKRTSSDPNISVACFDLQQILLTPFSNESVLYYSRKLCSFNLSIYDVGSKEGQCYIWHEALAGRGPSEIATCVYKYLKERAAEGKDDIILYSDNCGGQNRNKYFLTMLCYAKQTLQLKKIEHKFLERGHTQNENDSIHAAIEYNSRGKSIYTTPQWAATVRTARAKKPYSVLEMDSTDFLDFKQLSQDIPNFQVDSEGKKVSWMQIRSVSFENENCGIVKICYRDSSTTTLNLGTRKTRVIRSQVQDSLGFTLPVCKPLYGVNPLPALTNAKYQSLMHLCETGIVPTVHHHFYKNLRHETSNQ